MDARLEPYRTLVSFLGEALGPDYEVVLHDLTSEEGTIAAIVNNNISGRTEGAPLSNMALRFIHGKVYEKQPYVAGYQGASQAKGRLRSSTMFIKDGSELIGMLCINFDDSRYQSVSEDILRLCHPDNFIETNFQTEETPANAVRSIPPTTESFHNSIGAVAGDAVGRELLRLGVTADRLTPDERVQIIGALEAGGIFLLKGAVKDVADALHCSQASVYRYLSQIKKEDSTQEVEE